MPRWNVSTPVTSCGQARVRSIRRALGRKATWRDPLQNPVLASRTPLRTDQALDPRAVSGTVTQLCGINSAVECQLPKLKVAGSNPVSRSKLSDLGAVDRDEDQLMTASSRASWTSRSLTY